jgi:hypothetical protein
MGELTIRLDDTELLDALGELAKMHNCSIEEEINNLLQKAVRERARLDFVRRVEAITAMTPRGVRQTDSTLLIREDRDR